MLCLEATNLSIEIFVAVCDLVGCSTSLLAFTKLVEISEQFEKNWSLVRDCKMFYGIILIFIETTRWFQQQWHHFPIHVRYQ